MYSRILLIAWEQTGISHKTYFFKKWKEMLIHFFIIFCQFINDLYKFGFKKQLLYDTGAPKLVLSGNLEGKDREGGGRKA